MSEPEIVCEIKGEAGVILLNRPKALNALTLGMVRAMREALDAWEGNPDVSRVIVAGAGERTFCAGGDIRKLYELGKQGDLDQARRFWREEYELNIRIKRYAKPYIALIDGIVMGGGVGVSLHGSHRVASERALFAMPEVGIGFFPDVGATYALPRLPHHAGRYLALTGERISSADMRRLELATHHAPSQALPEIMHSLCAGELIDSVLASYAPLQGGAPLDGALHTIQTCFSASSLGEVLERLEKDGSDFAKATVETIKTKSPTSLAITFRQMRQGGDLSFEEAMRLEFRIVSRICEDHDFYEGIRAAIVDKDRRPQWQPAALGLIKPEVVERYFADLGDEELRIPS